MTLKDIDFINY